MIDVNKELFFKNSFNAFLDFEDTMPENWTPDTLSDPEQIVNYNIWRRCLGTLLEHNWLEEWQNTYSIETDALQQKKLGLEEIETWY